MNFFKNACKKPRDRKATEQSLLKAASTLFAQKGYENTRTLDISKEAGVNEALIGRYFGGKEGLLTAILLDETHSESIVCKDEDVLKAETLPVWEAGKTLKDGILSFFKKGKEMMKSKEHFIRISHSRAFVDEKMAKMLQKKIIEQRNPVLQENLRTYLKGSKLKKEEIDALAMLISSTNFSTNFLGRILYQLDDERMNLVQSVFARALDAFVEKSK